MTGIHEDRGIVPSAEQARQITPGAGRIPPLGEMHSAHQSWLEIGTAGGTLVAFERESRHAGTMGA